MRNWSRSRIAATRDPCEASWQISPSRCCLPRGARFSSCRTNPWLADIEIVEVRMWRKSKTRRAYSRELPGGGFVAIDVTPVISLFHGRRYHGTLMVERRVAWRRDGHAAPVIAN